jgi:hypothetical protein
MKKSFLLFLILLALSFTARAEAVKLKNGVIINGSIVGRTEYVLNVQTTYGTISINQREVDAIMPDLYRVLLKGGGEFVGTVLDLDEFNLSLKTDSGVVNIDVAQIASMGIYDYGEAEKQQKYIEKKVELEQEALSALPEKASSTETAEAAASGSLSTSGLSFDPDLEKAFPSKPVVIEPEQKYNYHLHAYQGEEIKESSAQEQIDNSAPLPDEAQSEEQMKIKNTSDNYFALKAGAANTGLKLTNLAHNSGDGQADLGGNAISFGVEYKRKINKRLWLGADLSFAMIPKKYFVIIPDENDIKITGQTVDLNVLANFYFNPESKTRLYLLAGGGGSFTSRDKNNLKNTPTPPDPPYWITEETSSVSSTMISALGGLGIERSISDINIGLELRAAYVPYGGDLQNSKKVNCFVLLKTGWFF